MLIETTTFKLIAGADEAAFLDADRRVQAEVAANHPGFLRRTTARGPDGEWLVVVLWRSADDADASSRAGADHQAMKQFAALVDPVTVQSARYTTLD